MPVIPELGRLEAGLLSSKSARATQHISGWPVTQGKILPQETKNPTEARTNAWDSVMQLAQLPRGVALLPARDCSRPPYKHTQVGSLHK